MTIVQRRALDDQLRQPHPPAPTDIGDLRTWFAEMMAAMPVPASLGMTPTQLGGRPALRVEPSSGHTRPGTVLYLHGGAWVVGSPQTAIGLVGGLVERTGFMAVSLDYRLAPEHAFPAAFDDVVAAYREMLDAGQDPGSIAFVGDSAGGGLSVGAALAVRDAGLPVPAAIVTLSGWLDQTLAGASMATKADRDFILSPEVLAGTSQLFLAGHDPADPRLSPAITGDLHGLPPLLLQAGTNEVLLDDSVRLADRARDHGVDVLLDVTDGVPHVFQTYTGTLSEADEALDRAALFLRQRLISATA